MNWNTSKTRLTLCEKVNFARHNSTETGKASLQPQTACFLLESKTYKPNFSLEETLVGIAILRLLWVVLVNLIIVFKTKEEPNTIIQ